MKKYMFFCVFLLCLIVGGGSYVYWKQRQSFFPIDLVYLWVDGSDENWARKKAYWQEKLKVTAPYAVSPARWRDREELKHSLRSVEKYMPWIHKIYIVTDNQVPEWLNTDHPKIKIIDHSEILPQEALPVFNSMAIETGIANIPGLSEHFIYANDDMFVNKPLSREFFFTRDGMPVFYSDAKLAKEYKDSFENRNTEDPMWVRIIDNERKLIQKKLDPKFDYFKYIDTHTLTAYKKSIYQKAMDFFVEELKSTQYSKFRSDSDLGRSIVFAFQLKNNEAIVVDAENVKKYGCKKSGILVMSRFGDLERYDPCTFCLNDTQNISDSVSKLHVNILHKMFPQKSSFEK